MHDMGRGAFAAALLGTWLAAGVLAGASLWIVGPWFAEGVAAWRWVAFGFLASSVTVLPCGIFVMVVTAFAIE